MVAITTAALFLYKKHHHPETAPLQISKQADALKEERRKHKNVSSSTKVTSSQLMGGEIGGEIIGGEMKKRVRKKKRESTNRTSPSLVLQPIQ